MKIAVVGLGYWGPNLVRNLASLSGCTRLVLCDRRIEAVQALLPLYPQARATLRYEDVLDDPEVDAVVLATPVSAHWAMVMAALRAGKHVLCEKPLCDNAAAASELLDEAVARERLLMVGHTFLHSPPVMRLTELIESGEIGRPLYAQASRVNLGPYRSDVSVVWDFGPHDLSILCHWFDEEPARVAALGRSTTGHPTPDVAFLNLEFPSGIVAGLHLSWLAPTKVRRITLVADLKMVIYEDTNAEEPIRIYDKGVALPDPEDYGEYRVTYRTGDLIAPRVETWEPLRHELDHFLKRIEKGDTPGPEEERAVRIVAVLEAASRSMERGGTPVDVDPGPRRRTLSPALPVGNAP
jgi:predicted dehydrogenase